MLSKKLKKAWSNTKGRGSEFKHSPSQKVQHVAELARPVQTFPTLAVKLGKSINVKLF